MSPEDVLYPGLSLTTAEADRPLLGPPLREEVERRAVGWGADVSYAPPGLTVRQAAVLIRQWSTPAEQEETARLIQDLWWAVTVRARLHPPVGAPVGLTAVGSAVRSAELVNAVLDFRACLLALVADLSLRAGVAGCRGEGMGV